MPIVCIFPNSEFSKMNSDSRKEIVHGGNCNRKIDKWCKLSVFLFPPSRACCLKYMNTPLC